MIENSKIEYLQTYKQSIKFSPYSKTLISETHISKTLNSEIPIGEKTISS